MFDDQDEEDKEGWGRMYIIQGLRASCRQLDDDCRQLETAVVDSDDGADVMVVVMYL